MGQTLNPYPYAGRAAAPAAADGRNWFERHLWRSEGPGGFFERNVWNPLGSAYNENETFRAVFDANSMVLHAVGGFANHALPVPLTEWVAHGLGYDDGKMTANDRLGWNAGAVVGTAFGLGTGGALTSAARAGNAARAFGVAGRMATATAGQARVARGFLVVSAGHGLKTGGEGVAGLAGFGDEPGRTWGNGLKLLGFLGARGDLGSLSRAGAATRLGRGYLAAEAVGGRSVGAAAHWAAAPVVKYGVHGVVGKLAGARTYQRAIDWAERNGWKACFAGDTPIRTPGGHARAADVRAGDLLLSRDEHDPDGLVVAQRVEEVFERLAAVARLAVGGRLIRTTGEHPYFVGCRVDGLPGAEGRGRAAAGGRGGGGGRGGDGHGRVRGGVHTHQVRVDPPAAPVPPLGGPGLYRRRLRRVRLDLVHRLSSRR